MKSLLKWVLQRRNLLHFSLISFLCISINSIAQTPQNWVNHWSTDELDASQVSHLYVCPDSIIWAFNGNGVFEIADHLTVPKKISDLRIVNPVFDADSTLFYYKGDTLFSITEKNMLIGKKPISYALKRIHLSDKLSIPDNVSLGITCLGVEKSGNKVWVGTQKYGLLSLQKPHKGDSIWKVPNPIHIFKATNRWDETNVLISNTINSITCDSKGLVWVGFEEGLMLKRGDKWEVLMIGQNVRVVKEVIETQGDGIYVITNNVNPTSKRLTIYKNGSGSPESEGNAEVWRDAKSDLIRDLHIDDAGDLWLAGESLYRGEKYNTLSMPELKEKFRRAIPQQFSILEGFNSRQPLCLANGRNGIVWVGTADNGLFFIKKGPGLAVDLKKIIKCHNDSDGSFSIKAVEGKPPFSLYWKSKHNGNGISSRSFADTTFQELKADTFEFWLTDVVKTDTGYMKYILENPKPVNGKIASKDLPIFEDDKNGKVVLHKIEGGRVNLKAKPSKLKRPEGYFVDWKWRGGTYRDTLTKTDCSFSNLGLGRFSATIMDTLGCKLEITDSFPYPQRFSKRAWEYSFDEKETLKVYTIKFEKDSIGVENKYFPVIQDIANWIKTFKKLKIEIGGHTNKNCLNLAFCNQLSKDRADEVKRLLVSYGVQPAWLTTEGYGSTKPISGTDQSKNQRVEFKILDIDMLELVNKRKEKEASDKKRF